LGGHSHGAMSGLFRASPEFHRLSLLLER
jgi:hypothetical protein